MVLEMFDFEYSLGVSELVDERLAPLDLGIGHAADLVRVETIPCSHKKKRGL